MKKTNLTRILTIMMLTLTFAGTTAARAQNSSSTDTSGQTSATNDSTPVKQKKRKHIDLKKDFATLGDNADLEERAKNLSSNQKIEVVQNRIVDRTNRVELGVNGGLMMNGDAYINTQNLGVQADYHLNPNWSFGARYYHSFYQMNSEGNNLYAQASAAQNSNAFSNIRVPVYDSPIDTELAVVNFYPLYGKLNMFDSGVAHFDLYLLAGAGQVQLISGNSTTYTGGVGVGVWLSQHVTLRAEVRYQGYQDLVTTLDRQENVIQSQIGIGFLL